MMEIVGKDIQKRFGYRTVLENISFHVSSGTCFGIFGANGSGKSTLLQIVGGLQRADSGRLDFIVDGKTIVRAEIPHYCGFVAPYLRIYEEFTPIELMKLQAKMKGKKSTDVLITQILNRLGLFDRRSDPIRDFSSGLRQRILLALAVHLSPPVLLLDEPSTTMDSEGRNCVENEVILHTRNGGIVILASNDEKEKQLCSDFFQL